ncbi:hypothetical protein VKT23_012419 [Stygiomarasmius scandens]|uniref:Uncharacterized protein n=1 Tax=Marasmiellus scandens TaxID=2682957 RepID=A0ABR1JAN9_9AGAR
MVLPLPLFLFFFSTSFHVIPSLGQDHTACADSGLDWYTNAVGETPCRTYERVRQICNPSFQVGIMNTNTPPDVCNEQVPDCCCNSIAFGLSMLCLSCQQGFSKATNGFDAGAGAYSIYLSGGGPVNPPGSFCSPNKNQSFPDDIQTAVCNKEIRIFDSFYNRIYWSDGSWFYRWSSDFLQKDISATNGNTFTHCDSTKSSSQAPQPNTPSPSSESEPQSTSQSSPTTTQASQQSNSPASDSKSSSSSNASTSASNSSSSAGSSGNNLNSNSSSTGSSPTSDSTSTPNDPSNSAGNSTSGSDSSNNGSSNSGSTSMSPGVISGIVVGGVVVIILWGVFFWIYRRKSWGPRHFRAYRASNVIEPFNGETSSRDSFGIQHQEARVAETRPPSYYPSSSAVEGIGQTRSSLIATDLNSPESIAHGSSEMAQVRH